MVSPLWKACSEGDLQKVSELLNDASTLDIELKDHTGATPLIEAVKNGHVDIVRALLEKGADPTNASSLGRPEQYTSDQTILDLINQAQNKNHPNGKPSLNDSSSYPQNPEGDKTYYGSPHPGGYPYYPTINPSLSTVAEGGVYYPPPPLPPAGENHGPNGVNLPPPEIARLIPCRYFPACRYGSSCMFAHPQTPYFQGPPPPAHYPPYDPMSAPAYATNYYPVNAPSFQPPNGIHPMTPVSPPPVLPMAHGRSPSEVISPSQGHYSPNGIPPPPVPYGPMSPSAYPHPAQMPVPMTVPPLPLHQTTLPPPGPQSPSTMYSSNPSPATPFPGQHEGAVLYPQQPHMPDSYPEADGIAKISPVNGTMDTYPQNPPHRDSIPHVRRGAGRRGSFASRKPPCLFFPLGRCKNGDDCRFPHIVQDAPGVHHPPHFSARGGHGGSRPRGHPNGHFAVMEEKFNNMSIRDDAPRQQNGNGTTNSSRSHSSDAGHRPRYQHGMKHHHANINNGSHGKKSVPMKQRVPNADEFPVLSGSVTPPVRSSGTNGVANTGLTAAQVLQAPPPTRKDSAKDAVAQVQKDTKIDVNGPEPETTSISQEQPAKKLPISFAAVATAAPDVAKEVSVSA